MDEKLKATIEKIVLLAKQNPEFEKALRTALHVPVCQEKDIASKNNLELIKKYLGLDYALDEAEAVVDYSFVSDEFTYNQLTSDNREMLRYRYGTRLHKIDFAEYCRYVLLQAEMLLNYFYGKKNNGVFSEIKSHIHSFNPEFNPSKYKQLSEIPFGKKLYAYQKEFSVWKWNESWNNIKEVRNQISHRTPISSSSEWFSSYKEHLLSQGFSLQPDGLLLWKKEYLDNKDMKDSFNKEKKSDEYKRYQFAIWFSIQPFDEVANALKQLAYSVMKGL